MDIANSEMTLARVINFTAFCLIVVAMLGVEVAWSYDHLARDTRLKLHYLGFMLMGVTMAVEIVYEWLGTGGGQGLRRRGFPVIRRKDDK